MSVTRTMAPVRFPPKTIPGSGGGMGSPAEGFGVGIIVTAFDAALFLFFFCRFFFPLPISVAVSASVICVLFMCTRSSEFLSFSSCVAADQTTLSLSLSVCLCVCMSHVPAPACARQPRGKNVVWGNTSPICQNLCSNLSGCVGCCHCDVVATLQP